MSFKDDGNPCNSNDVMGFNLDSGEGMDMVPCNATTTTTTTTTTTSTTTTSTTSTTTPTTTTTTTTTTSTTEAEFVKTEEETATGATFVNEESELNSATTTLVTAPPSPLATLGATELTTTTTLVSSENIGEDEGIESSGKDIAQSFYTCVTDASDVNPAENSIQLDLIYDYELHWTQSGGGDGGDESSKANANPALISLEKSMNHYLAQHYGLVECDGRRQLQSVLSGEMQMIHSVPISTADRLASRGKGRRHLREWRHLRKDEYAEQQRDMEGENIVVALGSYPIDQPIDDQYDCQVQVDSSTFPDSSTCTPMRGHMTAWLQPDADESVVEAELLSLIQTGMEEDTFVSDPVLKISYVGVRDDSINNVDDSENDGDQGDTGANEDATGTSDNGNNVGEANGVDAIQDGNSDSSELEAKEPPLLAIGLGVFFFALVLVVMFGVYYKRRRNRSSGPEDPVRVAAASIPSQAPPPQPIPQVVADPDDVSLLPATEKLDMRSVHSMDSSDVSTDDTEVYDEEGMPMERVRSLPRSDVDV